MKQMGGRGFISVSFPRCNVIVIVGLFSSKKSGKGKRPGKGGNRYCKSVGLGFKTPREATEGTPVSSSLLGGGCNFAI